MTWLFSFRKLCWSSIKLHLITNKPVPSKEQYKKSKKCILIRTALHCHFYRDSKTNEVNKPVFSQKQKSYNSWLIEALENWPTQIHPYMWHTDPSYCIMYSTIREVRKGLSSPLQTAPCCECQNNESTCVQMDALLGECRNHDRPFFFQGNPHTPRKTNTHTHTDQTPHYSQLQATGDAQMPLGWISDW